MSVQHTPGPWQLADAGPLIDGLRIFAGDSHYIGFVGNSDDSPEQTLANATLVAAAPDLLQALDHAARSLLSMNLWLKDNPHCGVSDGARDILIRHQKEAETAVAQAKGGKT